MRQHILYIFLVYVLLMPQIYLLWYIVLEYELKVCRPVAPRQSRHLVTRLDLIGRID